MPEGLAPNDSDGVGEAEIVVVGVAEEELVIEAVFVGETDGVGVGVLLPVPLPVLV